MRKNNGFNKNKKYENDIEMSIPLKDLNEEENDYIIEIENPHTKYSKPTYINEEKYKNIIFQINCYV